MDCPNKNSRVFSNEFSWLRCTYQFDGQLKTLSGTLDSVTWWNNITDSLRRILLSQACLFSYMCSMFVIDQSYESYSTFSYFSHVVSVPVLSYRINDILGFPVARLFQTLLLKGLRSPTLSLTWAPPWVSPSFGRAKTPPWTYLVKMFVLFCWGQAQLLQFWDHRRSLKMHVLRWCFSFYKTSHILYSECLRSFIVSLNIHICRSITCHSCDYTFLRKVLAYCADWGHIVCICSSLGFAISESTMIYSGDLTGLRRRFGWTKAVLQCILIMSDTNKYW